MTTIPAGTTRLMVKSLDGQTVTVDLDRAEVFVGRRQVRLQTMQYRILVALLETRRLLTREYLLRTVWPRELGYDRDARLIDVHVYRLRKKLGADIIETVHDLGYKLVWRGIHVERREHGMD